MTRIRPVILAGGPGLRLWPLSDADHPKPFLKLDGKRSLLDGTIERLLAPDLFAPPVIACAAAHAASARAALEAAAIRPPELILEPAPRDTAAAVAAIVAARRAASAEDELILVAPADHMIRDAEAFRAACARGVDLAAAGRLVLFGAAPTSPHEGYGYIEAADAGEVSDVASFHEKPDRATAEAFLSGGAHLWNMGLFLAATSTFEALFETHAPEIMSIARRAIAEGERSGGALTLAPDVFAAAPKAAFDRAVVEKADGIAVVRVACGWSDLGSWNAVYDALPADAAGNVVVGDARLVEVEGTLVHSSGPKVAVMGVEGLAVITTADGVLVCRRADAQNIKALVAALNQRRVD
jgi:mannose-1-phosphate guanylyltransferase/mannose-1-phosphate guanylyltransferase/mannose-6-phosphate isomerase